MDEKRFINELQNYQIQLNDQQMEQFNIYYSLLVEWNKKVNLTAITDKNEVYLKHFFDSISPSFFFDFNKSLSICDIGAGAGFPSIPLLITFPRLKVTIVDSLQKRMLFLDDLLRKLNISNVNLVHGRAEDVGKKQGYRENFDVVMARAVARTNVLAEYCFPLCKISGRFIALKGQFSDDELLEAKNAIHILGGKFEKKYSFHLPIEQSDRTILIMKKIKKTPKTYPRKAGIPVKKPIM